jgi:hypothetical protein
LALEPAFEMVLAPAHKTFFYRGEYKRVIEPRVLNDHRLRRIAGPLLYCVSDSGGVLRYVGKWVSESRCTRDGFGTSTYIIKPAAAATTYKRLTRAALRY